MLDTNVVIMLIDRRDKRDRLPMRFRPLVRDPENRLYLSTASIWEIAIKQRSGKLDIGTAIDVFEERLASLRLIVLPLIPRHVIVDSTLPSDHRDPFDRAIAAVAEVEELTLLTTDSVLIHHPLAWRP